MQLAAFPDSPMEDECRIVRIRLLLTNNTFASRLAQRESVVTASYITYSKQLFRTKLSIINVCIMAVMFYHR